MSKRKHSESVDDVPDDTDSGGRALYHKKTLCAQRIDKGQKALYEALKLAAGFERQKFSRRKKAATASNDKATLARIEREYQVLKALNCAAASESHLYKTIHKVKSIATSPALPFAVQNPPKLSHDGATLNVLARLYKTNPVRAAVDEAISDLRGILDIPSKNEKIGTTSNSQMNIIGSETVGNEQTGEDEDEDEDEDEEEEWSGFSSGDVDDASKHLRYRTALDDFSGSESEDYARFEGRIARSSEDELDSADENASNHILRRKYMSTTPESSKPQGKQVRNAKISLPVTSKSTFLPSLSMGGYIPGTGSDSDPESDIEVAPPKKRRGQRARQAIWEKKYGVKAKHLQKPKASDNRNKGWDQKRGAQLEGGGFGRKGRSHGMEKPGFLTDANQVKVKQRSVGRKDDGGALHPSWQAAKLAKEKKQMANFQGKKMTFD